jgi:hypothetical protein
MMLTGTFVESREPDSKQYKQDELEVHGKKNSIAITYLDIRKLPTVCGQRPNKLVLELHAWDSYTDPIFIGTTEENIDYPRVTWNKRPKKVSDAIAVISTVQANMPVVVDLSSLIGKTDNYTSLVLWTNGSGTHGLHFKSQFTDAQSAPKLTVQCGS